MLFYNSVFGHSRKWCLTQLNPPLSESFIFQNTTRAYFCQCVLGNLNDCFIFVFVNVPYIDIKIVQFSFPLRLVRVASLRSAFGTWSFISAPSPGPMHVSDFNFIQSFIYSILIKGLHTEDFVDLTPEFWLQFTHTCSQAYCIFYNLLSII
jgi:hypothetical protein